MLIIPFDRRLDWRHPPWVTLTLLLANVLVFLFAQLDDQREVADAAEYYVESGLAALEVPRFKTYLADHPSDQVPEEVVREAPDDWPGWMWLVQTDLGFQERLRQARVITPFSDQHADWRAKRQAFEARYAAITFVSHGMRTARLDWDSVFSHMFLHAGIWHLLGNALFLVAVGCLVEATLKPALFLVCYLLAGLGSAAFNILFDPPSLVPGIGASGAISGLMGMYTVLYGLRRISFFYAIGIYFDYVKLPAIVLLPAWIGNELLQLWLYPDSNINYMAHLGGLVTGAALAFAIKLLGTGHSMTRIEQEDAEQAFERELAEARGLCDSFEYRHALPLLRKLYRQQPDHPALLQLYHEASRIDPASDDYHAAANRLMQAQPDQPAASTQALAVYREYRKLARPKPRFKPSALLAVLAGLITEGQLEEAERIVAALARQPRRDARLETLTRQLARSLRQAGETAKADHYRQLAEHWATAAQGAGQAG